MHWILYIEEYSPDIQYIPGPDNLVADALSRLPLKPVEALLENEVLEDPYPQETFLTCFASEDDDYSYHPLSYSQL